MKARVILTLAAALCLSLGAAAQSAISSTSRSQQVTWRPTIPRPTSPADLAIENIKFIDANGDNRIDANETFSIDFSIANRGTGNAYMIKPEVRSNLNGSFVQFSDQQTIKSLAPGARQQVRITGKSSQSIPDGEMTLTISAAEGNGFIPSPSNLNVTCYAFRPPKVVVGQYLFTSADGGVPRPNQVMTLKMIVQNDGNSRAENVKVDFALPKNVYQGSETTFAIGKLEPGEQQLIEFPFFTNSSYTGDNVTIQTTLSESYGRYAQNLAQMPSVSLSKSLDKSTSTTIEAKPVVAVTPVKGNLSLISDVNENIPQTGRTQPNIFALIIGNENYQNDKDIDVPFANSDASTFAEYMAKTIGIPATNISLIHDGTAAKMQTEIERVAKLAKSYSERGEKSAEIILYYAGHGLTSNTRDGYLLPVDVAANNVNRGVRTADLYKLLSSSGAGKVSVFIDACFSGETRGSSLLEGRGVMIEPNQDVIQGNIVVFTATQKDQIAYAYNEKLHGMFTYFLLNKLKETAGDVDYQELSQYLTKEVNYQSLLIHYTEQTPEMIISPTIEQEWKNWRMTAK